MRKLIGIGIIFLVSFSCQNVNHLSSDNILTKRIETMFKSDSKIIDLSQLNSFEWDELIILGPYSVVENVENELNLDLENIRENKIEYDDSINLLVFLKNRKSIKISEVSRGIGDFMYLFLIIEKEKSKFIKSRNGTYNLAR